MEYDSRTYIAEEWETFELSKSLKIPESVYIQLTLISSQPVSITGITSDSRYILLENDKRINIKGRLEGFEWLVLEGAAGETISMKYQPLYR